MSTHWSEAPRMREFLVSVELFISNAVAANLPKPPKRSDKHDAIKQSVIPAEDNKKVREKASWLSLAKGPTGQGYWRGAKCRLRREEGERCVLNIYLDESILYQTIYIHLLHHSDIRITDTSLFHRKYCLGIYCAEPKQRWSSVNSPDPLFLDFESADACNAWLVNLRSYAISERYGTSLNPKDGGSYRMWRQVEVSVLQGRNLGNIRPVDGYANDGATDADIVDMDVGCELWLNNVLCGRTTVKKGLGAPDWHESFRFTDLPPFECLDIQVMREKKVFKTSVLGTVSITLNHFRRGESVEGWYPVLIPGPNSSDIHVGDIRVKIRVDEEIILPNYAYSGLLSTLNSRNYLDWMIDFESKLKLKAIVIPLTSIAISNDRLLSDVRELAVREVTGTSSSRSTLFRGNTPMTKMVEQAMKWYGREFLEASVGPVMRRIFNEKVTIEVDPIRSGKGARDAEKNVDQLIYWCKEFWGQIYAHRRTCPEELRKLFGMIRKLVETHCSRTSHDAGELRWQSVSAFCFLRFIVPAILHPHLFGLCPGLPSHGIQRTLTLVAKVIQSLANLNLTMQKEEFMRGVKEFLHDSREAMIDYLLVVSSPSLEDQGVSSRPDERYDGPNIAQSLNERTKTKAVLDRESIPSLPYLVDTPRDLAVITSAVIRHSRDYLTSRSSMEEENRALVTLCSRCYEVEEQALKRVNVLAARLRPARALNTRPPKIPRPSTAPTSSDSRKMRGHVATGSSPLGSPVTPSPSWESSSRGPSSPTRQRGRLVHLKSTSTDSVPSLDPGAFPTTSAQPLLRKELSFDTMDDAKQRKGFFRGILKR